MWKILLLLAVVVLAVNANPVREPRGCSQPCRGSKRFRIPVGKTLAYDYESKTLTAVPSISPDKASITLGARVQITTLGECNLAIKLSNVRVTQQTNDGPQTPGASDLTQYLESALPVPFTYQDGLVESFCPPETFDPQALNIISAILSTFQNSFDALEDEAVVSESDIFGKCLTHYEINGNWPNAEVLKVKDLAQCDGHGKAWTHIQSIPYTLSKGFYEAPLYSGKQKCTTSVSNGVIRKVECNEKRSLRPDGYGGEDMGTTISVSQSMTYQSEQDSTMDRNSIVSGRENNLSFRFVDLNKNSVHLEKAITLLEKLQMQDSVEESTSQDFRELVRALRTLDINDLEDIKNRLQTSQFNEKARNFWRDALAFVQSATTMKMVKNALMADDLDFFTRRKYLISIALAPNPTVEMLDTVKDLLSLPKPIAVLEISSLARGVCLQLGYCSEVESVKDVVTTIAQTLSLCDNYVTKDKQVKVITALKGLGNIGAVIPVKDAIMQCISSSQDEAVKVAALQSFRRASCDPTVLEFMKNILLTEENDSELRVSAFKGLLTCPVSSFIDTITEVLSRHTSHQLRSYIWSYLINTVDVVDDFTESAFHKAVDPLLHNQDLIDKAADVRDFRKFSKHFKKSYLNHGKTVGVSGESDYIFSGKSFVPRSVSANITVNLLGQSINVLELGLRTEGLEDFIHSVIHKHENVPSTPEYRPDNDADLERVLESNSIPVQTPQVGFYARIFGNDILYVELNDDHARVASGTLFGTLEQFTNSLGNEGIDITRNTQLFEGEVKMATSAGFPLTLAVDGTLNLKTKAKISFDYDSITKLAVDFKPSSSIRLTASVVVTAAEDTFAGVKISTLAHSDTSFSASLSMDDLEKVNLEILAPEKKQDFITLRSDLFLVSAEGDKEFDITTDISNTHCSEETVQKLLGLKLCSELSYTNLFQPELPVSLPIFGPFKASLYLEKIDAHTSYKLSYENTNANDERRISLILDTPGSNINRRVEVTTVLSNEMVEVTLVSPWSSVHLSGMYRTSPTNIESSLSVKFNRDVVVEMTGNVGISSISGGKRYEPTITLSSPFRRNMQLTGFIESTGYMQGRKHFELTNVFPYKVTYDSQQTVANGNFSFISNTVSDGFNITFASWISVSESNVGFGTQMQYNIPGRRPTNFLLNALYNTTRTGTALSKQFSVNTQNSFLPLLDSKLTVLHSQEGTTSTTVGELFYGVDLREPKVLFKNKYLMRTRRPVSFKHRFELFASDLGVNFIGDTEVDQRNYLGTGVYNLQAMGNRGILRVEVAKQERDYITKLRLDINSNQFKQLELTIGKPSRYETTVRGQFTCSEHAPINIKGNFALQNEQFSVQAKLERNENPLFSIDCQRSILSQTEVKGKLDVILLLGTKKYSLDFSRHYTSSNKRGDLILSFGEMEQLNTIVANYSSSALANGKIHTLKVSGSVKGMTGNGNLNINVGDEIKVDLDLDVNGRKTKVETFYQRNRNKMHFTSNINVPVAVTPDATDDGSSISTSIIFERHDFGYAGNFAAKVDELPYMLSLTLKRNRNWSEGNIGLRVETPYYARGKMGFQSNYLLQDGKFLASLVLTRMDNEVKVTIEGARNPGEMLAGKLTLNLPIEHFSEMVTEFQVKNENGVIRYYLKENHDEHGGSISGVVSLIKSDDYHSSTEISLDVNLNYPNVNHLSTFMYTCQHSDSASDIKLRGAVNSHFLSLEGKYSVQSDYTGEAALIVETSHQYYRRTSLTAKITQYDENMLSSIIALDTTTLGDYSISTNSNFQQNSGDITFTSTMQGLNYFIVEYDYSFPDGIFHCQSRLKNRDAELGNILFFGGMNGDTVKGGLKVSAITVVEEFTLSFAVNNLQSSNIEIDSEVKILFNLPGIFALSTEGFLSGPLKEVEGKLNIMVNERQLWNMESSYDVTEFPRKFNSKLLIGYLGSDYKFNFNYEGIPSKFQSVISFQYDESLVGLTLVVDVLDPANKIVTSLKINTPLRDYSYFELKYTKETSGGDSLRKFIFDISNVAAIGFNIGLKPSVNERSGLLFVRHALIGDVRLHTILTGNFPNIAIAVNLNDANWISGGTTINSIDLTLKPFDLSTILVNSDFVRSILYIPSLNLPEGSFHGGYVFNSMFDMSANVRLALSSDVYTANTEFKVVDSTGTFKLDIVTPHDALRTFSIEQAVTVVSSMDVVARGRLTVNQKEGTIFYKHNLIDNSLFKINLTITTPFSGFETISFLPEADIRTSNAKVYGKVGTFEVWYTNTYLERDLDGPDYSLRVVQEFRTNPDIGINYRMETYVKLSENFDLLVFANRTFEQGNTLYSLNYRHMSSLKVSVKYQFNTSSFLSLEIPGASSGNDNGVRLQYNEHFVEAKLLLQQSGSIATGKQMSCRLDIKTSFPNLRRLVSQLIFESSNNNYKAGLKLLKDNAILADETVILSFGNTDATVRYASRKYQQNVIIRAMQPAPDHFKWNITVNDVFSTSSEISWSSEKFIFEKSVMYNSQLLSYHFRYFKQDGTYSLQNGVVIDLGNDPKEVTVNVRVESEGEYFENGYKIRYVITSPFRKMDGKYEYRLYDDGFKSLWSLKPNVRSSPDREFFVKTQWTAVENGHEWELGISKGKALRGQWMKSSGNTLWNHVIEVQYGEDEVLTIQSFIFKRNKEVELMLAINDPHTGLNREMKINLFYDMSSIPSLSFLLGKQDTAEENVLVKFYLNPSSNELSIKIKSSEYGERVYTLKVGSTSLLVTSRFNEDSPRERLLAAYDPELKGLDLKMYPDSRNLDYLFHVYAHMVSQNEITVQMYRFLEGEKHVDMDLSISLVDGYKIYSIMKWNTNSQNDPYLLGYVQHLKSEFIDVGEKIVVLPLKNVISDFYRTDTAILSGLLENIGEISSELQSTFENVMTLTQYIAQLYMNNFMGIQSLRSDYITSVFRYLSENVDYSSIFASLSARFEYLTNLNNHIYSNLLQKISSLSEVFSALNNGVQGSVDIVRQNLGRLAQRIAAFSEKISIYLRKATEKINRVISVIKGSKFYAILSNVYDRFKNGYHYIMSKSDELQVSSKWRSFNLMIQNMFHQADLTEGHPTRHGESNGIISPSIIQLLKLVNQITFQLFDSWKGLTDVNSQNGLRQLLRGEIISFQSDFENGEMSGNISLPFQWSSFKKFPAFSKYVKIFRVAKESIKALRSQTRIGLTKLINTFLDYETSFKKGSLFPPFKAVGSMFEGGNFVTFDGNSFYLEGQCTYVLVTDAQEADFTILVTMEGSEIHSITALDGGYKVEMLKEGIVKKHGVETQFPVITNDVTVTTKDGGLELQTRSVVVKCTNDLKMCVVELPGIYFGRVGGLLGSYNNEVIDDFKFKTLNDFVSSWSLQPNCQSVVRLPTQSSTNRQKKEECAALFKSKSSIYSGCFSQVNATSFYSACLEDPSSNACDSSAAYALACQSKGVVVRLSSACVSCVIDGKTVDEGMEEEVTTGGDKVDAVFLMDGYSCQTPIFFHRLTKLASQMASEFREQSKSGRFALVAFVKRGNTCFPTVLTYSQGQELVNLQELTSAMNRMDLSECGGQDLMKAARYASLAVRFRPGAARHMIAVQDPCSKDCRGQYAYSELNFVLADNGIRFHLLKDLKFEGQFGDVLGFDQNKRKIYEQRDASALRGDAALYNQISISRDYCVAISSASKGFVFDSSKILNVSDRDVMMFARVWANKFVEPDDEPNCQSCVCVLDSFGQGRSECGKCSNFALPDYLAQFFPIEQS